MPQSCSLYLIDWYLNNICQFVICFMNLCIQATIISCICIKFIYAFMIANDDNNIIIVLIIDPHDSVV